LAQAAETVWYGLRRVNPFPGVVAVVKRPDAGAFSIVGLHRQGSIMVPAPPGGTEHQQDPHDFRFGIWSQAGGLTRVLVNPTLDVARTISACDRLVDALPGVAGRVPFPLADELELC
jgi:hypothetical protein